MKGFVLVIICLLWLWGMYYGYTLIVAKTLKSVPAQERSSEEVRKEDAQRQKIRDSMEQQRQLMQDRQRTMRNYQNR